MSRNLCFRRETMSHTGTPSSSSALSLAKTSMTASKTLPGRMSCITTFSPCASVSLESPLVLSGSFGNPSSPSNNNSSAPTSLGGPLEPEDKASRSSRIAAALFALEAAASMAAVPEAPRRAGFVVAAAMGPRRRNAAFALPAFPAFSSSSLSSPTVLLSADTLGLETSCERNQDGIPTSRCFASTKTGHRRKPAKTTCTKRQLKSSCCILQEPPAAASASPSPRPTEACRTPLTAQTAETLEEP
mmetsp:Transcript_123472/g.394420  ORF Transcript_123472/g.394420 Transcript_123472/m.394420 type:complete len:245 (-) Transcript_123472:2-736(-)